MRVAVIGSGIAGLSAAWLLSQEHEVTLYEKASRLGMDAHGLDLEGPEGPARIDIPLRVFFDGFYPNLTALYSVLGIESQPINYSASFGRIGEATYFRYDNYRLGPFSLPFLKGVRSLNAKGLRIGWQILRFFRGIPGALDRGLSDQVTLVDFLKQDAYSREFAEGFLYPAFAGICTCSHERIKAYPARIILEYLNTGLLFSSVRRVTQGTQEVVQRLSARVHRTRLDTEVRAVVPSDSGVRVDTPDESATFDHAVLATQANQSIRLLDEAMADERRVLSAFAYEPSRVIVHRDPGLAPPGGRSRWSPVNFLLADSRAAPMATIWMNAIQDMADQDDVFQSWNPVIEPDPESVLAESHFERPVVNGESLTALERLEALHEQADRRVWFCGSFAARGIPLLESATHSALSIAERLGCRRPWQVRNGESLSLRERATL